MMAPVRRDKAMAALGCKTLFLVTGCWLIVAGNAIGKWSWQEPQAKELATGDLEWAPHPFVFAAGSSVQSPGSGL
jgi:hypothetical protein